MPQYNIASDNDLSPVRHQAIIWTNADQTEFPTICLMISSYWFSRGAPLEVKNGTQQDLNKMID